jgi:hypothetical protein
LARLTPENRATKWSLLVGYNADSADVEPVQMEDTNKAINTANYVWDTTTLAWVKQVQSVLITDSVYLAVDDLETLVAATNTTYLVNIMNAVEIMDDWDESNRAKVNLIAGQAGITGGAGAVGASTPRVTLASDDPAVSHLATLAGSVGSSFTNVRIQESDTTLEASTITPLNATSSWTSGELDLENKVAVGVFVHTDKTGTLAIAHSFNGTNWMTHSHAVAANTGHHVIFPALARYWKVTLTNGAQAQTSLNLNIYSYTTAPPPYMESIEGDISGDDVAVITKSIIAGETTAGGGAFVNVKVNPSGTLEVNAEQSDTEWAVQWSEGLTELQTLVTQLDTDFGALLVYAEQHDTDFGTMISHLSAIQTAVQIMDDWDLNDRCRVSPISGQDGVQGGEGAISATTQRVTVATDDDLHTTIGAVTTAITTLNSDMDTNFNVTQANLAALESYAAVADTNWDTLLVDTNNISTNLAASKDLFYFFDSWLVDGTTIYVAKVTDAGAYYIQKIDTATGIVTYEAGSGGVPSSTGWAALGYQRYNVEF